jgi:hypothetical protein
VPNDPAIVDLGAYGQVTPEQQARYAVLAYQRAIEEWPWVGVVNFWFFKRASDAERNQAMYYFRMVEPDFTPMPVYDAMREYTAGLIPALYPGVHQEDHWALEYAGDWETVRANESASQRIGESASQRELTAVLGTYRRTTVPGATLHFWFVGASLTWKPGPGTGEAEVSVDGSTRRVLLGGQPVRLVRGWQSERHEITLTAVAGEVGVDALTVQSSWRPSSWLVLGVAGLLLAVAWVLFRPQRRR